MEIVEAWMSTRKQAERLMLFYELYPRLDVMSAEYNEVQRSLSGEYREMMLELEQKRWELAGADYAAARPVMRRCNELTKQKSPAIASDTATVGDKERMSTKTQNDKASGERYHQTGRFESKRSKNWPTKKANIRGIKSWEVPGTLNGVPVNALPDSGSGIDAVSEGFADRHNLKIERSEAQRIHLLGGHEAEVVGRIYGDFIFRGETQSHRRQFHVLRNSMFDMVLGKKFLSLTKTLTENCHRIFEKLRPCLQRGKRLFLLGDSPDERLRCTVNGAKASGIRRGKEYRRHIELVNGSTVLTDGMVLNAELQFDVAPHASRELDYDHYRQFAENLASITDKGKMDVGSKASFICDLHVIEGLPCDIILSNDFIFENNVFSAYKHLFCPKPAVSTSSAVLLERSILAIRLARGRKSWLPHWRQKPDERVAQSIPLQDRSWDRLWYTEAARRNLEQLVIDALPESQQSNARELEKQKQGEWDENNPRPPSSSPAPSEEPPPPPGQMPQAPPPAVLPWTQGHVAGGRRGWAKLTCRWGGSSNAARRIDANGAVLGWHSRLSSQEG